MALACSIVGSVLLAAAAASAQPAVELRRELSAEARATLQKLDERGPYEALAQWTLDGTPWLDERPDSASAAYREAVVCALWHDDPNVAFGGACRVDERQLAIADIDRWLDAVMPHVFEEHGRYDYDTLKHIIDERRIHDFLDVGAIWDADIRSFFISDLHRSLRPSHVATLSQLAHHQDLLVRRQAFNNLAALTTYSSFDRGNQRALLATEMLKWRGTELGIDPDRRDLEHAPRAFDLPEQKGGYPPLLVAALERWFLEITPGTNVPNFGPFLMRWADDLQARTADVDLLTRLGVSEQLHARSTAARALARLRPSLPPASIAALDEAIRGDAQRALLHIALGRTADVIEMAQTSEEALGVALEFDVPGVWDALLEQLAHAPTSERAVARLEDARVASHYAPFTIPLQRLEELRAFVDERAEQLPAPALKRLLLQFERFRTPAICSAVLRAVDPADLKDAELLAALELHDADQLRGRLKTWALASELEETDRELALRVWIRLGLDQLPESAIAFLREQDPHEDVWFELGRGSSTVAVREFIVETARRRLSDSASWLAIAATAFGLDAQVARGWAWFLSDLPKNPVRDGRWLELVTSGDPVAALEQSLRRVPIARRYFIDVGLVRDPRILAVLREAAAQPGASVQDIVIEMALAGDAAALAEMAEVRERKLYGWIDDASVLGRTMGRTTALFPYWIGEIGTICCRRNGAAHAIEELTGFDAHRMAEQGIRTQEEFTAGWHDRFGPHLRWSRIANRFVVAPH